MKGRVLAVAGSDSGGGAGIQADLKTITALGGYAATAVTALTAQNTVEVRAVHPLPPEFVAAQIESVLSDIGADCIKTGMMHSAPIIEAVVAVLTRDAPEIPIVVDPVLIAKSGDALLDPDAMQTLKARLVWIATLLTPNVPEAEALTGRAIGSVEDMMRAAEMMLTLGPRAILLKGGHLKGEIVPDVLISEDGIEVFEAKRLETRHTHGTGCTLASGIATGLAQGMSLRHAVERARSYLRAAIDTAPELGAGHGPVNHGVTCRALEA